MKTLWQSGRSSLVPVPGPKVGNSVNFRMARILYVICVFAATAIASPAQTLTTLYSFCVQTYCADGLHPGGLVQATDGNFYGTTQAGGIYSSGTTAVAMPAIESSQFVFSEYAIPTANSGPFGIAAGPDGALWFAESAANQVGRVTTSGRFTEYHIPTADAYPENVAAGSDGALWFTEYQANQIGRITTSGMVTEYPVPTSGSGPFSIVAGPDGALWFTELQGYKIGKITTSGQFTEYPIPDSLGYVPAPAEIIIGADGALWFTGSPAGLGRITTNGDMMLWNISWDNIAVGPDRMMWYAGYTGSGGAVGQFYETQQLSSFNVPPPAGPGIPGQIITGPDSALWFVDFSNYIVRFGPPVSTTTVLTTAPNPSNLGQAVTMTATVTAQNGSTPTGTVVFDSNGVQIGSASLNNSGVAVLMYTGLPLGTESLMAVYQGSGNLASSTSNPVLQVVGGTVTTVTSTPNPSTVGEVVHITATVSSGAMGGPTPTGTVGFTSNGTGISGCSSVTLNSGVAICTTSSLALGTDAIVASYSGDSDQLPSSGTLVQIVNPVPNPIEFVPVTPCRIVDTRGADGTFGGPAIPANSSRSFPLSQSGNPCNIPSDAIAYSLNVTVVPITTLGYLTIWPSGEGQPIVSTLNSPDGRVKANAAIVPAGTPSGSVSVYVTNTTNVILDIDGYFAAPTQGSLQFYTLTPCRIVDTRNGQDQGSLQAGVERDYTIPPTCDIPSTAAAYSFNVTVVPTYGALDYLTVWPQGESRPTVSTLNNKTGTLVANAAIVPAGSNNATAFYAHNNNTDLLLDVNGYFAAPGTGGLSLYPLTPCRVLDTRQNGGAFMGEKTVNVVNSACAPPSNAQAYVFNATVVPPGSMPFLTLWPDGENQPTVSTLNARDGFITSNMAIVPTNNGSIDAYAKGLTQLILDISGYFAP